MEKIIETDSGYITGSTYVYNYKCEYYVNEWKERHGKCVILYNDHRLDKKEEYEYFNGKKNGIYKLWIDGKTDIECSYVNDKLHGTYKKWWDGEHKEVICEYIDGKVDGKYESFYPNYGDNKELKQYEGKYKNDKLNGEWKQWNRNGILIEWKYHIDSISKYSKQWTNLKYHYKSWKTLTKLITNKKIRWIIKTLLKNKNSIWNLQGDNVVFKTIIDYIHIEEVLKINRDMKIKS